MQEHPPVSHRKVFLAILLVSCLILMIFYYDDTLLTNGFAYNKDQTNYLEAIENATPYSSKPSTRFTSQAPTPTAVKTSPLPRTDSQSEELEFLVYSSKCKIVNLNPFNNDAKKYFHPEKYKACRSLELLTYVTKTDNTATLHIDYNISPSYTKKGISCCYSNVTRKVNKSHPDSAITISSCKIFDSNVTIYNDPVMVKCTEVNNTDNKIYENVHIATLMKDDVKKKLDISDNNTKPLSVLFVGIDSISRLSFIRALPKTFKFVEDNGWIPLKGYNKMDDNTFPNLMAILTGYNQTQSYKICNPKVEGMLDKCDMVWFDYRKLGYVTAYGEDEGSINTFNYGKEGFTVPPADYYFRPYVLATEKLSKIRKDSMTYCTGPETAGERILNLAKDFSVTFKGVPNFGFFWMNSFSHNKLNSPTGMDDKVKSFLEDLTTTGVTENSIVFFLSDHGMRFGDIRVTDTGWLEERLPFIYVSFPKWFQQNYTKEYENFKINTYKLTTPYDIYMTLQHILVLSGHNYTVKASTACPQCKSLFEEMESERSCEDAGITQHWCTCTGYKETSLDAEVTNKVSNFFLERIHSLIRSRNSDHRCAKYSVDKILGASLSQRLLYKNETYLLVKLKTNPRAIFETTITYVGDIRSSNFSLSGGISRLDSYEAHSRCVDDAYLRNYCYCRSTGVRV